MLKASTKISTWDAAELISFLWIYPWSFNTNIVWVLFLLVFVSKISLCFYAWLPWRLKCPNYEPRRKNLAIKRAAAAATQKKSLAAVSEISDDDEDFELEVVAVLQKLGKSEKDEGISIQQEKWFFVGQGWWGK